MFQHSVFLLMGARLGGGTFNFSFSQPITERTSLFDKYSGEITNENDSLKKYVQIAFIGFSSTGEWFISILHIQKKQASPNGTSLLEFLYRHILVQKLKNIDV